MINKHHLLSCSTVRGTEPIKMLIKTIKKCLLYKNNENTVKMIKIDIFRTLNIRYQLMAGRSSQTLFQRINLVEKKKLHSVFTCPVLTPTPRFAVILTGSHVTWSVCQSWEEVEQDWIFSTLYSGTIGHYLTTFLVVPWKTPLSRLCLHGMTGSLANVKMLFSQGGLQKKIRGKCLTLHNRLHKNLKEKHE